MTEKKHYETPEVEISQFETLVCAGSLNGAVIEDYTNENFDWE